MSEGRIMVVEDDILTLSFLVKLFERRGFEVEGVPSGGEAVRRVEELGEFDLVLLDIVMPGLSGVEVCELIRERYPMFRLPVLFLTALAQPSEVARALEAGGNDYIVKPPQEDELFARVRNLIRLKRAVEENEELQELLRLKERLFNLVAHDVKVPASSILQAAALLREGVPAGLERYLSGIEEAAGRILGLVKGFLGYARVRRLVDLERGAPVDLSVLLLQVVQRWKDRARAKGVGVAYGFDRGRPWTVRGDPLLLEELMDNLVGNAVKYTYPDTLVRVMLEERDGRVRFAVADEGPGVKETDRERIFQEFVSLSREGGMGLGLALVREVARLHGARVGVEDAEGGGAVFWVEFEGTVERDREDGL